MRRRTLRRRIPDLQPTTTLGQYTTLLQTTVIRSWRWAKNCPKHVELIQRSIKLLLLHLVGHLYYSLMLYITSKKKCCTVLNCILIPRYALSSTLIVFDWWMCRWFQVSFSARCHFVKWAMLRCGGKFRLLVALRLTAPSLLQNGGFRHNSFFGGEYEYGVYMICIV
jgi:hypothetical protein